MRDCVRPAVCDHDDDDILRENLEKRFSIDFEFTSGSHELHRVLIHISLGNQSSVRVLRQAIQTVGIRQTTHALEVLPDQMNSCTSTTKARLIARIRKLDIQ